MLARDAIYTFTENLIDSSSSGDALYESASFRSLKGGVDESQKVVRVDVIDGLMAVTDDPEKREQGVRFTVQFWVTPASDELSDLDEAKDLSFDMARQWFDALHADQTLSGQVCIADVDVFETGDANLGTIRRGVTYLDGEINPIGQG